MEPITGIGKDYTRAAPRCSAASVKTRARVGSALTALAPFSFRPSAAFSGAVLDLPDRVRSGGRAAAALLQAQLPPGLRRHARGRVSALFSPALTTAELPFLFVLPKMHTQM